ncbi:hypothetical protein CDAR_303821 [Caerostris darwini]|uniref:Uncharacterized protein n=1 Tax=Caerostris darwini TaxID=1538125 RepID=A0AAV4T8M9_9ARAC|nr:hypothetical protein CDAR_303821 [Caerostris darwini]
MDTISFQFQWIPSAFSFNGYHQLSVSMDTISFQFQWIPSAFNFNGYISCTPPYSNHYFLWVKDCFRQNDKGTAVASNCGSFEDYVKRRTEVKKPVLTLSLVQYQSGKTFYL